MKGGWDEGPEGTTPIIQFLPKGWSGDAGPIPYQKKKKKNTALTMQMWGQRHMKVEGSLLRNCGEDTKDT